MCGSVCLLLCGRSERVAASISAVTEAAQSASKAQLQRRFLAVLPRWVLCCYGGKGCCIVCHEALLAVRAVIATSSSRHTCCMPQFETVDAACLLTLAGSCGYVHMFGTDLLWGMMSSAPVM